MRYGLLVLGLLALVFLVMPTAMAKFTGQHRFINGSNVDCTRCHQDVADEFSGSPVHYGTVGCKECHIGLIRSGNRIKWSDAYNYVWINSFFTETEPLYANIGPFHGAALVECLWCHVNNTLTGSNKVNVLMEFNNSDTEAHRPLFWRAMNASGADTADFLRGANEACVACHTHAANVTIIEPTQYLNITANFTECAAGTPDCYDGWDITFGINSG